MDIVAKLHEAYYLHDQTPENLVSSYWKEMHTHTQVKRGQAGQLDLRGVGFGDFEYNSWRVRLLSGLTVFCYLIFLNNRREILASLRQAKALLARLGFPLSYDCFRFVCTATLLKPYLSRKKAMRIVNIGDGYGFLSAFIKELYPDAKIVLVDLGKTLLFQAHYCSKAFPERRHCLVGADTGRADIESADFIYCPAEHLARLNKVSLDAAVNIASMEEMNEITVREYFAFLRRNLEPENFFYCCNRIEKVMEGGEVSRIFTYPWQEGDRFLVDEICPWHQFFLAGHASKRGPRLWKWRIPLINYFDGPHQHRLAVMKTEGFK